MRPRNHRHRRRQDGARQAAQGEAPVVEAQQCENDGGARLNHRPRGVERGQQLEPQIALQQRIRHNLPAGDEKREAHHHHYRRKLGGVEERSQRTGDRAGNSEQQRARSDGQRIDLRHMLGRHFAQRDDRLSQAKFADQRHQPEIERCHAEQSVIGRR